MGVSERQGASQGLSDLLSEGEDGWYPCGDGVVGGRVPQLAKGLPMSMVRIRRDDGMFLMTFGSEHGVPRVGDMVRVFRDDTYKVRLVVWLPEGDSSFPSPQVHVWLDKK